MFVVLEHVIADVYAKLKPAGDYLSIYHHGTYESLDDAYESLLCYMESNQLTKLGEFYESYIVNQLTTEDETSYITKISVAVAK